MKKLLLGTMIILFLSKPLCAQDVHLSQFFETPLLRNPALAGIFTGDMRAQVVYRNQWRSIGYPYSTKTLSGEYKFSLPASNDFITLGVQAFYDLAGSTRLTTVQFMPAVNFHKSLSIEKSVFLSAGFAAALVQRNFDDKRLTFDNQYLNGSFDPSAPSGENFSYFRASFADFATGLSFNTELPSGGNVYLGASLFHFNKPARNYREVQFFLDPKWQANAGIKTPLGEQTELLLEGNYLKQGSFSETIVGGELMYYLTDRTESSAILRSVALGGGAFIRLKDAIIPVVKLNYNNLEISWSYDVNISNLSAATTGRGGYEISLSYRGFTQSPNSSLNMVRCPRF